MISRSVSGLYAVALAALWSVATVSIVSAAEPSDAMASETAPSEGSDGSGVQNGQPAEGTPDESTTSDPEASVSHDGLQVPFDGIRRSTDVVGEVVGHPTGKVLMAAHDVVTLRIERSEGVAPHTLYAIARREQFVEHPDSGRNMGYVVRVVATVELEAMFGRLWSGRIVSSTDYVTLDDWVIPFEPAVPGAGVAASDLVGHVVAVRDELVLAGKANVVYTDLGAEHGVKPRDEFSIIRPGTSGRRGGPDRSVGVLRILAVQPSSSSGYLTMTSEPILVGDRLEHPMARSAVR